MRTRSLRTIYFLESLGGNRNYKGAFFAFLKASAVSQKSKYNLEKSSKNPQFRNLVSRLKKDGIIENKEGFINLTKKGLEFLDFYKSRKLPNLSYKKEAGEDLVLVTFDIPEKFSKKRDWLRRALKQLGFTMLRQSVWVGKVFIPKDFLIDLKEIGLIPFVDVMKITKRGSLGRIS